MKILKFQNQFAQLGVFSLDQVRLAWPDFSYRQVDRWQKKAYLQKLKQGFYRLPSEAPHLGLRFQAANRIYSPSYISLQSALKFYGLIPEELFHITSVSSKKTAHFDTPLGHFFYQSMKPELFWGYELCELDGTRVQMARLEKAILDLLYLNPDLKTEADFYELRLGIERLHELLDRNRFERYLNAFDSTALRERVEAFLKFIDHA